MNRFLACVLTAITSAALLPGSAEPAVAAAGTATVAAGTAETFFAMFQEKNDWTWSGGDQATSLRAANGLTYWSFGDTVLGEEDPVTGAYRPGWRMVANSILVQRGADLSVATPGAAVPDPGDGDRYWTQGMFEAGGSLYVLCQRVGNLDAGGFELRGVDLARFAFGSDGSLAFQGMVATPSTGKIGGSSASTAQYGADAVVTGAYVYVFGYANAPQDPYAPQRSYVARVPTAQVETPSAWRFQRNGGEWVVGMGDATAILKAQVSSVRLVNSRWLLAYKPWNGWGDTVYVERRRTPYGAPVATKTIASPGGTTPGGQRYQTYSPQLHPEQTLTSGRLLVSVAWNGETLTDLAADADLYKPRFYEIDTP